MSISQNFPTLDPTLRLNFQGARRLDPRVTFTRASTATYIDEDGLVKTAGVDQARFDYDPATGESLGLLIEEQRTNLHLYSQEINSWSVESGGSVVANNQTSPDGTQNADTLTGTQYGSSAYVITNLNNATTYTFSVFLKYTSGSSLIEIQIGDVPFTRSITRVDTQNGTLSYNSGGAIVSYSIEPYANGWYRYSITRTTTASGGGFMDINHVSNTTSEVAIWGAQVEQGSFPTSYIPTSGDSITRSADTATFTSQEISTTGTLLSLGGGSPSSPASYNSSEVNTSTSTITLNSQLSDSSTIPTLLYYPEPISGDAIRAMRAYAPIVKDGLVLHLDAGVDKSYPNSGTTWRDLSGQGNNGQVNGAGYNDINGGSLTFDGTDDTVSIPGGGSLNISTTLTATVWVYYISGNGRIFQKDGPPYTRCWEIGGYAGQFRMEMWHSNGATTIGYGNALTVNGWTHLALTFDGTDIKMYQNSLLVSTINFPGDIRTDSNTPIFLGGVWDGEFLNGRISNAQLYNRALTSAEILQNFNASRSRFNI